MKFSFEQVDGVLKVILDGRLVASCSEEFKTLALQRLESAQCKQMLCDLSLMSHIDSSGLGALVFLLQKLSSQGGTVKLANLQPRPRIVFDITKVYRVFEIFDTVDEALASFRKTE